MTYLAQELIQEMYQLGARNCELHLAQILDGQPPEVHGIVFPTFTSMFSRGLSAEEAGEYLGHSQSMAQTGRALGPYWGGWAIWGVGITAPFWLGGIGMLAALVIFLASLRVLVASDSADRAGPAHTARAIVPPGTGGLEDES